MQGRRHLNDALGQVLADAAKTRRKSLPLLFRDDIAPFVEKMIPASEIAALQAQINKLAGPITPQKITFAQKALSAALATGAGTAAAEVQPVTRFMEE